MEQNDQREAGRLLDDALAQAGISQYRVAQRLANIRGVTPRSADQALRRIRRFGQVPTKEFAEDLAQAFHPELDLPADHFYVERNLATASFREEAAMAVAEIAVLRERVAALERLLRPNTTPPTPPTKQKQPKEPPK